jgi:hypothetical protein
MKSAAADETDTETKNLTATFVGEGLAPPVGYAQDIHRRKL